MPVTESELEPSTVELPPTTTAADGARSPAEQALLETETVDPSVTSREPEVTMPEPPLSHAVIVEALEESLSALMPVDESPEAVRLEEDRLTSVPDSASSPMLAPESVMAVPSSLRDAPEVSSTAAETPGAAEERLTDPSRMTIDGPAIVRPAPESTWDPRSMVSEVVIVAPEVVASERSRIVSPDWAAATASSKLAYCVEPIVATGFSMVTGAVSAGAASMGAASGCVASSGVGAAEATAVETGSTTEAVASVRAEPDRSSTTGATAALDEESSWLAESSVSTTFSTGSCEPEASVVAPASPMAFDGMRASRSASEATARHTMSSHSSSQSSSFFLSMLTSQDESSRQIRYPCLVTVFSKTEEFIRIFNIRSKRCPSTF